MQGRRGPLVETTRRAPAASDPVCRPHRVKPAAYPETGLARQALRLKPTTLGSHSLCFDRHLASALGRTPVCDLASSPIRRCRTGSPRRAASAPPAWPARRSGKRELTRCGRASCPNLPVAVEGETGPVPSGAGTSPPRAPFVRRGSITDPAGEIGRESLAAARGAPAGPGAGTRQPERIRGSARRADRPASRAAGEGGATRHGGQRRDPPGTPQRYRSGPPVR